MADVDVRATLLEVIAASATGQGSNLQSGTVLNATARKLGFRGDELEQALLTQFHELFRTGLLAWGLNISNANPPFFHLTDRGKKTLERLSGDPGNPAGYLSRIDASAAINPIARSYIGEAVNCYISDLYKAGAVMLGGAAESLILELRDAVVSKLEASGRTPAKGLKDWQASRVLGGLKTVLDAQKLPKELKDRYESFWPAFTQQIRAVRNDAGHPSAVDPVTSDTLHSSLLIFPELLKLSAGLRNWVATDL
jgi:hypothetical protein